MGGTASVDGSEVGWGQRGADLADDPLLALPTKRHDSHGARALGLLRLVKHQLELDRVARLRAAPWLGAAESGRARGRLGCLPSW